MTTWRSTAATGFLALLAACSTQSSKIEPLSTTSSVKPAAASTGTEGKSSNADPATGTVRSASLSTATGLGEDTSTSTSVSVSATPTPAPCTMGAEDRILFDQSTANWYVAVGVGQPPPAGWPSNPHQWGASTFVPLMADLDGDCAQDRVAFDPASASWFALLSSGAPVPPAWPTNPVVWGNGDWTPFIADVDGDGLADRVMFDPVTANWYAAATGGHTPPGWPANPHQFGVGSWIPWLADVDGDRIADRVMIDPTTATWYAATSTGKPPVGWGANPNQWGNPSWTALMGDVDGDGIADRIMFDPATATWYASTSSGKAPKAWGTDAVSLGNNTWKQAWGNGAWLPFIADVDGDGTADRLMFDPATATWYAYSSKGVIPTGWPTNPHAWGNGLWAPMLGLDRGNGYRIKKLDHEFH